MSDAKTKMQSIAAAHGGVDGLIAQLRELLEPQAGMSDPLRRGFAVLKCLEDRDLFELFTGVVSDIPRDRTVASLARRLSKKVESQDQIIAAYPAFERWLAMALRLTPDTDPAAGEFEWEREYDLDGMTDLRRLIKFSEHELRKLLEETKGFPALARNQALNRHLDTQRKLIAELLRIEVNTGHRKSAPTDINMNVKASGAFQELMQASSKEKTSTVHVIDSLLKVVDEYAKDTPEKPDSCSE